MLLDVETRLNSQQKEVRSRKATFFKSTSHATSGPCACKGPLAPNKHRSSIGYRRNSNRWKSDGSQHVASLPAANTVCLLVRLQEDARSKSLEANCLESHHLYTSSNRPRLILDRALLLRIHQSLDTKDWCRSGYDCMMAFTSRL